MNLPPRSAEVPRSAEDPGSGEDPPLDEASLSDEPPRPDEVEIPAPQVGSLDGDDGPAAASRAPQPEDRGDETRRPPKRSGLRSVLPAPIWHVGRLLVLALIVEYLVVPQLAGPR